MAENKRYANQHKIYVEYKGDLLHKENQKNLDGSTAQFCQAFNWAPMMDVMSVLTANEFKIYLYILKWAGKTEGFNYAPADIEILLGIGESTAQKTKKRFIELGFLEPITTNTFKFNPTPKNLKQLSEIEMAKRIVDRERRTHKTPIAADL